MLILGVWLGLVLMLVGCSKDSGRNKGVDRSGQKPDPAPVAEKPNPANNPKQAAQDLEVYTKELKEKNPPGHRGFHEKRDEGRELRQG
jgi:hypothetical protein